MNFDEALEQLKNGAAIRLPEWSPDVKIKQHSAEDISYFYIDSKLGRARWRITQSDLYSNDWEIARKE